MTRLIDEAMVALQSAIFAREHYGPEHPAVAQAIDRSRSLLVDALKDRPELCVFLAADRVVALDRTLASSDRLREGLFRRLGERDVSSLTFTPGVTSTDLAAIVKWLCDADADEGEPPRSGTPHVRTGTVEVTPEGATHATPRTGDAPALDPTGQSLAVRDVWTAVSRDDWRDTEGVESVVGAICGAVTGSRGMLLPLATLKRHDEYTFVHTTNVAILTASLAEVVGLRESQVLDLTTAALLHDVGKRAVPKELLNKRDKLTDHEIRVMRRHPVMGARLLFDSKRVPDVVPVVAFEHHIHLDGSGYPHVKPGWRTSLASQIVQVADVYDALRTNRPYRAALSREVACEMMMRDAGVRFDDQLLMLFFERVAARTDREALPDVWAGLSEAA